MSAVESAFWHGRRVFLTGHTGFKGSWLSLWLQHLGAQVHGYALAPPTTPALFTVAEVGVQMASTIADVRDAQSLHQALDAAQPEVVFHLAAQPLVRASYLDPAGTYATNVMGTVHLLDAVRRSSCVRAVVNVTTDKCYDNQERAHGYREDEPLGGHDPYSSSKACSELVTAAYRQSYFKPGGPALASARAGNVIGGGDWAPDRLVPDLLRAVERHEPVRIRHPGATRPWQHVLEPLSGYLTLAQRLVTEGQAFAEAWNFGPHPADARPVGWLVDQLCLRWGAGASWQATAADGPHEATQLSLDIRKAGLRMGWQPRWSLDAALDHVVAWHQDWRAGQSARALCLQQITEYSQALEATVA